jgi:hypothetical protein
MLYWALSFGKDTFHGGAKAPTLNLAIILNAGTIHEGIPFSDFSIFAPIHFFFGIFLQNWSLQA